MLLLQARELTASPADVWGSTDGVECKNSVGDVEDCAEPKYFVCGKKGSRNNSTMHV